ncbi:TIGR03960 family B12-binding radical SAM protein [bacterium]|nr:TIGR03960 family B12-binding radical SAM protein [bacterium]
MKTFEEEYHNILYNCNKPYQYVGGEFLSCNKDFDAAKVRYAFAFPDKYEIGISNLGVRVLYEIVNQHPDFMADRVYAPEVDFKNALINENKLLYALESKRPLKSFDIVGFSLQYELAYPTVLKMLEMMNIPIKSSQRQENDPIVMAGGPCCFNPLPMSEFIDVFCIGDGEDLVLELCETIKFAKEHNLSRSDKLKELSKLKGVYIPQLYNGEKIKKRIVQIDYENALKKYPIPFSSSVHDRATVEIRRGCGRMCRFCQPGHVTLPVREREGEDVVKITKELVQNTGYDEYSLLSLSSNDYGNIKEVIKELSCDFNERKISVSLPSQRIDHFSTELAQLVQGVRKSTMTLAPEAGSQRLRNVIRKNITEEQILYAILSLYEKGWSKVKLYFIIGLPTETYDDLDEMANLFSKIKYRAKLLKQEHSFKHNLDLTCTFSIFVPKPFTPFQWCPQFDLEEIDNRIKYLKEKTKHIKGLKINYHEKEVSQIEAVITRGDKDLCKYVEELYKKGCYLDAWIEHFDKNIWKETALMCGFTLSEKARHEFKLNDVLPWNIIDIGVNDDWLKQEYTKALTENLQDFQPSCEKSCINCGVCKNLNTKKIIAKPYVSKGVNPKTNSQDLPSHKYRIKLSKRGVLRYFSHLDWQNTFLKSLERSGLKMAFSNGFNPTMKVSLGVALPLFMESNCELVDIELKEQIEPDKLKLILCKVLPRECEIFEIKEIPLNSTAIDHTVAWAKYEIKLFKNNVHNFECFKYNVEKVLNSQKIILEKKNKKGILKTTNVKSSIKDYYFDKESLFITVKTGQGGAEEGHQEAIAALRADDLMKIIMPDTVFDIKRLNFFDIDGNII